MGNGDRTLDLEPGTYTLTAPSVAGATASVDSSPFTIKSNATTNVTVTYTAPPPPPPPPAATTGTITVTVTGLPAGVYAPIQYLANTTGAPVNQSATTTTPVNYTVPAGTHTIAAGQATSGGVWYTAPSPSRTVTIAAGQTQTVNFNYGGPGASGNGTLTVRVAGLPGNMGPSLGIAGPNTYTVPAANGSSTFTAAAVGTYSASPPTFTSGSTQYKPTQTTFSASVSNGSITTLDIVYTAQAAPTTPPTTPPPSPTPSSALEVRVSGLAEATSQTFDVSGPTLQTVVLRNGVSVFPDVTPGNYKTATLPTVIQGGKTYKPSAALFATTVVAGQTGILEVVYVASSPPNNDVIRGDLEVRISGLGTDLSR